jgi:hypothetical protein
MRYRNNFFTGTVLIFTVLFLMCQNRANAQVLNEANKKRVSIAFGMFTDIWLNVPTEAPYKDMKTRTINQGVNVFATYNIPFGKSNFGFSAGLGIRIQNLYWNYMFQGNSADSFQFVKIDTGYKRSKVTMPYLELPIEFRFKTKYKFAVSIGFKVSYMVYGHTKYVGDDYLYKTSNTLRVAFKDVKNIERFAYGPTLRIGYKWFHLSAYYSLSRIFTKDKGPDMIPISVGFVLMPF